MIFTLFYQTEIKVFGLQRRLQDILRVSRLLKAFLSVTGKKV
jgi:hypothetical protein